MSCHSSGLRAQSNQTISQVFFQAVLPVGVMREQSAEKSASLNIRRARDVRGIDSPRFSSILVKRSYANSLLV